MKRRVTVQGKNVPPQKACMSCGRNEHKVAIREQIMERNPNWTPSNGADYTRRSGRTEIFGYCPSCSPSGNLTEGRTLIYDRRGERSRKAKPLVAYAPPAPTFETTESATGRRVWATCGHPAERDVNDNCLTCGGRL